ncbi:MAG: DUF5686 family protein [Flavisolibacter sp.]
MNVFSVSRVSSFFFLAAFFLLAVRAGAQNKIIAGQIRDQHSAEHVPFASVQFRISGAGRLADSAGGFLLFVPSGTRDTLQITCVGYQDFSLPVDASKIVGDTLHLLVNMVPGKFTAEVVIRKKVNRGLLMWKRIVAHKPMNDRYRFENFSYELYNKLELDLKNFNREKLSQAKLMKPFNFILKNIDTADGISFLPAYLTESISDYYYQKTPLRRREVFKAVKTIGIDNESIAKLTGGMDQNVNIYDDYIPVFDKQFVSPISSNGDAFYNYKIADTQYVGGRRLIHFLFVPKKIGTNTFEGDCWIHDTSFAIQKMNLRLGKEANVNYVDRLSLIQEYQLINDSTWFLAKDKFVVDVSPGGKTTLSFIGRKTTTYRNVLVNDPRVVAELAKNKRMEETVLPDTAKGKTEKYWTLSRHEELSANEKSIYKMVDTLLTLPAFQRYTRAINFIGTGYLPIGSFLIGPWQNWVTANSVEGLRLRFDLGTNSRFSKNMIFHGYAAYGFGDQKLKGEVDGMYLFKKSPRLYLYGEYMHDFDRGQAYFDEFTSDNIFAVAIRKQNVPVKYLMLRQARVELFKEWQSGFSVMLSSQRRQYDPVKNLPAKENFFNNKGEALNSLEGAVRLRFAYLEKFLENTFYRTSLGSPYPIVEFRYTRGFPGAMKSSYSYNKIFASVSNYRKIPPYGNISFNVFAGRTYGTVPFLYLDVAPGNEIYYYNKYAYNMMNRYEFIHDRFAGINFEHNIGNGLFRFIPLTRKLKFRQFWTAKTLWGSLSEKNYQLNAGSGLNFQSLNGKTYLELGTGVDNIFKVLRFDFVWRVLPTGIPIAKNQRFGVFGSFRFSF